jgi:ankyrin repeat protein
MLASDESKNDQEESSIFVQDDRGDLPLHRALAELSLQSVADRDNANLLEQRIKSMVRAWPGSVDVFNKEGLNPLHIACREGAPLAVIQDLVIARPNSIKTPTRNKRKMLPLHLACRYYAGPTATWYKIIKFLLQTYPAAAEIKTGQTGELALHLCCQNYFCTVRVLGMVVKAYPDALKIGTHEKRQLPLHLACERHYFRRMEVGKHRMDHEESEISSSSDDIIRYLVHEYAESVTVYDTKGQLPLHAAVRGYQSTATVKFLLSVFPESIQYLDDTGRTALHICVSNAVPDLAMVRLLLKADPTATVVADDYDKIPLLYAAPKHDLNIINTLIRARPAATIQALRTNEFAS